MAECSVPVVYDGGSQISGSSAAQQQCTDFIAYSGELLKRSIPPHQVKRLDSVDLENPHNWDHNWAVLRSPAKSLTFSGSNGKPH